MTLDDIYATHTSRAALLADGWTIGLIRKHLGKHRWRRGCYGEVYYPDEIIQMVLANAAHLGRRLGDVALIRSVRARALEEKFWAPHREKWCPARTRFHIIEASL